MREIINTPPWFRFKPRDDELIHFYLKPKIIGQQLHCNVITDDIEIYIPNSNTWLLFDMDNTDYWDDEHSLYVFTFLFKVSTDPNFTE